MARASASTPMLSRWAQRGALCFLAGALALALVACGGDGSAGGTAFGGEVVAQRVAVSALASGTLKWDKESYEATAGDITFVVSNPSPTTHQFTLTGNGVNYRSKNIGSNTTQNLSVAGLPAGEYQIVCDYPGHKAAGMIAKLIVR